MSSVNTSVRKAKAEAYVPPIEQVRAAGERILDSLRPGDLFDIVAFGSHHRVLFGRALPANRTNVARAREFVLELDADLGGTEIASALRAPTASRANPAYRVTCC